MANGLFIDRSMGSGHMRVGSAGHSAGLLLLRGWLLAVGGAALAVPTLIDLARDVWATDVGGYGPFVLATGIWLFFRSRAAIALVARPGNGMIAGVLIAVSLVVYIAASMTGMLGVRCLAVYTAFVAIFYFHAGAVAVRKLWFPLIYILFMFPQPETLVLPLSREMKLLLSSVAVKILALMGMSIGQAGVVIYFDQYELLVADACSGLRSLTSLSAIGVFFCYIHYDGHWRQSLPLLLAIPFIALTANLLRVLTLIGTTHWFGEAFMERYVHSSAGILLFSVAVALMLGADRLVLLVRQRRSLA